MARILLVEDMPEIRRMLRSRLQNDHEIVGELTDGYDAVSAVEEKQPDVVIMDFKMPTVSGVEATRQITDRFPDVVVAAYTSSGHHVRDRMLGAGAAAVFAKEDLTALVAFVDSLK